jgi:hypothetical protein
MDKQSSKAMLHEKQQWAHFRGHRRLGFITSLKRDGISIFPIFQHDQIEFTPKGVFLAAAFRQGAAPGRLAAQNNGGYSLNTAASPGRLSQAINQASM